MKSSLLVISIFLSLNAFASGNCPSDQKLQNLDDKFVITVKANKDFGNSVEIKRASLSEFSTNPDFENNADLDLKKDEVLTVSKLSATSFSTLMNFEGPDKLVRASYINLSNARKAYSFYLAYYNDKGPLTVSDFQHAVGSDFSITCDLKPEFKEFSKISKR